MHFDSLEFMQRFRGEISLSAIGTDYHRNILNNQQIRTFALTARHMADFRAFFAANITDHSFSSSNHDRR